MATRSCRLLSSRRPHSTLPPISHTHTCPPHVCTLRHSSSSSSTATLKRRPPRLPVVLCHGLYGWDRVALGPIELEYWAGITGHLRSLGCTVLVARVPPTADIETRARHLDRFLATALPGRDVSLVAHSMGGLDARFLLAHLPNQHRYFVRSLTTIATPHRGSPFMDWVRDRIGLGRQDHSSLVARLFDSPAYANLTTDYLQNHFNPSTPDRDDVFYQSYGAVSSSPSILLRLPHAIVHAHEGPNDGLVSVQSARWGLYRATIPADHWALNKHRDMKWLSQLPLAHRLSYLSSSLSNAPLVSSTLSAFNMIQSRVLLSSLLPSLTFSASNMSSLLYTKKHALESVDVEFMYGYQSVSERFEKKDDQESAFDVLQFYTDLVDGLRDCGF